MSLTATRKEEYQKNKEEKELKSIFSQTYWRLTQVIF